MRFMRVIISCSVVSQAWPRCSFPVTFGGGMTMENGSLLLVTSDLNKPALTQFSYLPSSTSAGLYFFGISISITPYYFKNKKLQSSNRTGVPRCHLNSGYEPASQLGD